MGVPFNIVPPLMKEGTMGRDGPVEEFVRRIALLKARSSFRRDSLIIGADTLVSLDSQLVLGKPRTSNEALKMLQVLLGKEHFVTTGIAVILNEDVLSSVAETKVKFKHVSDEFLQAYVDTGEPIGKAGGYGIQEKGALLIESIEGSYSNVVGLPLELLAEFMGLLGIPVHSYWGKQED